MNHIYEFNLFKRKQSETYKKPDIEDIEERLLSFKEEGINFTIYKDKKRASIRGHDGEVTVNVVWRITNEDKGKYQKVPGTSLVNYGLKHLAHTSSDDFMLPIVKKLNSIGYRTEYNCFLAEYKEISGSMMRSPSLEKYEFTNNIYVM